MSAWLSGFKPDRRAWRTAGAWWGAGVAVGLLVAFSQHSAYAQLQPGLTGQEIPQFQQQAAKEVQEQGNSAIGDFLSWVLNQIASLLAMLVGWVVKLTANLLISNILGLAEYNDFLRAPAVVKGWTVVRDVTNLGFILVLLVMAFGTALNLGEKYNAKHSLPKFVLMAVLVNFSKSIIGAMIDLSQVVMLTFVNAFKDRAAGNLISALGLDTVFSLSLGFDSLSEGLDNFQLFIATVYGMIVAIVAVVVLFAVLLVLFKRVVTLWLLVVMSPLAFLLSASPLGAEYAEKFWKKLSEMLIAGPLIGFFLWLALAVMEPRCQRAVDLQGAYQRENAGYQIDGVPVPVPADRQKAQADAIRYIQQQCIMESFKSSNIGAGIELGQLPSSTITQVGRSEFFLSLIISVAMLMGGLWAAGLISEAMAEKAMQAAKMVGKAPGKAAWAGVKRANEELFAKTGINLDPVRWYHKIQETREGLRLKRELTGTIAAAKGGVLARATGGVGSAYEAYFNLRGGRKLVGMGAAQAKSLAGRAFKGEGAKEGEGGWAERWAAETPEEKLAKAREQKKLAEAAQELAQWGGSGQRKMDEALPAQERYAQAKEYLEDFEGKSTDELVTKRDTWKGEKEKREARVKELDGQIDLARREGKDEEVQKLSKERDEESKQAGRADKQLAFLDDAIKLKKSQEDGAAQVKKFEGKKAENKEVVADLEGELHDLQIALEQTVNSLEEGKKKAGDPATSPEDRQKIQKQITEYGEKRKSIVKTTKEKEEKLRAAKEKLDKSEEKVEEEQGKSKESGEAISDFKKALTEQKRSAAKVLISSMKVVDAQGSRDLKNDLLKVDAEMDITGLSDADYQAIDAGDAEKSVAFADAISERIGNKDAWKADSGGRWDAYGSNLIDRQIEEEQKELERMKRNEASATELKERKEQAEDLNRQIARLGKTTDPEELAILRKMKEELEQLNALGLEEGAKITLDPDRADHREAIREREVEVKRLEMIKKAGWVTDDARKGYTDDSAKRRRLQREYEHEAEAITPETDFEAAAARRHLVAEELRKVEDAEDWTELKSYADGALERGDWVRFLAVFKKAAMDANDNEFLNAYGFDSNFKGMQKFTKEIMMKRLGMDEQLALQSINEVSYVNESKRHWETARVCHVEDGKFKWSSEEEHVAEALAEIRKISPENVVRDFNRLAYGGEDPHTRSFKISPLGIAILTNFSDVWVKQMGGHRMNKNAMINFDKVSDLLSQIPTIWNQTDEKGESFGHKLKRTLPPDDLRDLLQSARSAIRYVEKYYG